MITIRSLTTGDLGFGLSLSKQAGWNQVLADWQRLLSLEPQGFFLALYHGRPAGTVGTCIFGHIAWAAMMLVDSSLRRCGIGSALLRHALDWLDANNVRTVRLDATPVGLPMYEKHGFKIQFELTRYAGELAGRRGRETRAERRFEGRSRGRARRRNGLCRLLGRPIVLCSGLADYRQHIFTGDAASGSGA